MGAGVSAVGEIFAEKGHFEQGWCFAASSGIQRPGDLDRRTRLWRPFGQALDHDTPTFFFFFFFSFLFSGGFVKSPPSANLSIPTGPDHKTFADQSRGSRVPVRLGAPVQRADARISWQSWTRLAKEIGEDEEEQEIQRLCTGVWTGWMKESHRSATTRQDESRTNAVEGNWYCSRSPTPSWGPMRWPTTDLWKCCRPCWWCLQSSVVNVPGPCAGCGR